MKPRLLVELLALAGAILLLPLASAAQDGPPPTPTLLEPAPTVLAPSYNQRFGQKDRVTLRWTWVRDPSPGEQFQVHIWPVNEPPRTTLSHLTTGEEWVEYSSIRDEPAGYCWTVAVVYAPHGWAKCTISQPSEAHRYSRGAVVLSPSVGCQSQPVQPACQQSMPAAQKALPIPQATALPAAESTAPPAARSTALPAAQRARLSVQRAALFAPALIEPMHADKFEKSAVTLSWSWPQGLRPGEQFQVHIWPVDKGPSSTLSHLTREISWTEYYSAAAPLSVYSWTVSVVDAPQGWAEQIVGQPGEVRRYTQGTTIAPSPLDRLSQSLKRVRPRLPIIVAIGAIALLPFLVAAWRSRKSLFGRV